jgi:hypothetical protein
MIIKDLKKLKKLSDKIAKEQLEATIQQSVLDHRCRKLTHLCHRLQVELSFMGGKNRNTPDKVVNLLNEVSDFLGLSEKYKKNETGVVEPYIER